MGDFFEECLSVGENLSETAKCLYEEYQSYCIRNRQSIVSNAAFGRMLAERGFSKKRNKKGIVWHGLGLKSDEFDQQIDVKCEMDEEDYYRLDLNL